MSALPEAIATSGDDDDALAQYVSIIRRLEHPQPDDDATLAELLPIIGKTLEDVERDAALLVRVDRLQPIATEAAALRGARDGAHERWRAADSAYNEFLSNLPEADSEILRAMCDADEAGEQERKR